MTGVPPSGSGHSPKGEAAISVASPAKPSVPNAVHCVAVALSRHSGATVAHTMTQSWSSGTREFALSRALEFALREKPGFSIDQWLVAEVPLPLVELDDGARTSPRYAAKLINELEPGRSGLIFNLERLADHLDACAASAIEARSDATGTGAAEGESATLEEGDAHA